MKLGLTFIYLALLSIMMGVIAIIRFFKRLINRLVKVFL
jgi:hypothetical protein